MSQNDKPTESEMKLAAAIAKRRREISEMSPEEASNHKKREAEWAKFLRLDTPFSTLPLLTPFSMQPLLLLAEEVIDLSEALAQEVSALLTDGIPHTVEGISDLICGRFSVEHRSIYEIDLPGMWGFFRSFPPGRSFSQKDSSSGSTDRPQMAAKTAFSP